MTIFFGGAAVEPLAMVSSSDRQSLMPSFLYSSSFIFRPLNLHKMAAHASYPSPAFAPNSGFMIPALNEPGKIEMYSLQFYATCTINPAKYKKISSGFGVLLKEQGAIGLFRDWVPTLLGYSTQGACEIEFYEFFKKYFSDLVGPENAVKYKHLIYLVGSASAELIADVALCPMGVVKRA